MKNSLIDSYLKKSGKTVDFSNKNNVIQPQYGLEPKKTSTLTKVVAGVLVGTMLLGASAGVLHSCSKDDAPKTAQTETTNER